MKLLMAALAALAICGCAINPEGWEMEPSHPPLPARWAIVGVDGVHDICGIGAVACAHRDFLRQLCFVYAEMERRMLPPWIVEHEEKHCAGYDHI